MKELLIFSERQSNRLVYMANVLTERWCVTVKVTTDKSVLMDSDLPVYNYSNLPIQGLLNTIPNRLLFEKRIQGQDLNVENRENGPYLYANNDSFLGFDPLAAAFFFLSRYEEYLPHRKDEHDRFTSKSSVLFKLDSVQCPLVDLYIEELRLAFVKKYKGLALMKGVFQTEITFDIDRLFLYDSKGIAKTIIGAAKDLILNRAALAERLEITIIGAAKDPLHIYEHIGSMAKDSGLTPRFFFQVGESSRYDHNNPVHLPTVRNLIHEISLKADIGLHPSYFTCTDQEQLILEHDRLKRITNQEIQHSRQHYLRFSLPNTYRWLENMGVSHDYSMGFSDVNGFRAGTAYPFRFYDLGCEETLGLTVHPFIFMDLLSVRSQESIDACKTELDSLLNTISITGGVLNTTWHPETLVGYDVPFSSMPLLEYFLQKS